MVLLILILQCLLGKQAEMAEENAEVCGFLDVKFFGGKSKVHRVKKRTLGPWKVWKRHWCSIRKLGSGLGIQVHLDYGLRNDMAASTNERDGCILIPFDSIIYRTQSRSKQFAFGIFPIKERKPVVYLAGNSEIESQRWMANIRQLLKPRKHKFILGSYKVSMIDNAHSKAAGMAGIVIANSKRSLSKIYKFILLTYPVGLYGDLMTNHVGIIIKDDYSGETIQNIKWNELSEFHLTTTGKPEDVKCICVLHTTKEFRGGIGELYVFCSEATKLLHNLVTHGRGPRQRQINHRHLSLSEGDLRILSRTEESQCLPLVSEAMELKTLNKIRESNEKYEEICKIPIKMSEGVLETASLISHNSRRISDISTTSGIYEEISDEKYDTEGASRFYMAQFFNHPTQDPPPLPPRQRCASESIKGARSVFI